MKILSKESQKGPTYKKGGCLFSTHTQTNDKSQKPQMGRRRGERRIKRSEGREGNDRESWRRLGERSVDRARRPITNKRVGDNIFSPFFHGCFESIASFEILRNILPFCSVRGAFSNTYTLRILPRVYPPPSTSASGRTLKWNRRSG